MNRKERRAAEKRSGSTISPMAQTLAGAFRAHQAGHRAEAERLYRDVLSVEPRNAPALHLLGALLHQSGRSDDGISLIKQAIAIEPHNPDYHYNLGSVLQSAGRLPDAAAQFEKAIALKSNYPEAQFELGNIFARMARWPEAAANFRRVLSARPNDAITLNNLGMVLREQGELNEAAILWQRAIAATPSYYLPHMNLGLAYKVQGRTDEAVASLKRALELKPDAADAIYNLAVTLMDQGRHEQALQDIMLALDKAPTAELRALFVTCIQTMPQIPTEDRIRNHLARALSEGWSRPEQLGTVAATILKSQLLIQRAIATVTKHWPRPVPVTEMLPPGGLAVIAQDALLLAALQAAPISDFDLERFLSGLRFALLAAAKQDDNANDSVLRLSCALARQCFLNGYVWAQSDDETMRVRELQNAVGAALQSARPFAPQALAAIAAYGPLHALPYAALLAKRQETEPLAGLIAQQAREPLAEDALRTSFATLTDVPDSEHADVSSRWTALNAPSHPLPIEAYLRRGFPQADIRPLGTSQASNILVARCGSGREALEIARRHPSPDVLAIDSNAADLAFGARQAQSHGIANVTFAVAEASKLKDRSFDVIDAARALDNAEDGPAAIETLAALLRPRGFMLISLAGDRFRQSLRAARDFARTGNYQPDSDGIRLIRQNILRLPEPHDARQLSLRPEFYDIGGCRTLLFVPQDNPLTFGNLAASLAQAGLLPIGFDVDLRIADRYRKRFTTDASMTDIANWQALELAEPDLAAATYNLWVQKT